MGGEGAAKSGQISKQARPRNGPPSRAGGEVARRVLVLPGTRRIASPARKGQSLAAGGAGTWLSCGVVSPARPKAVKFQNKLLRPFSADLWGEYAADCTGLGLNGRDIRGRQRTDCEAEAPVAPLRKFPCARKGTIPANGGHQTRSRRDRSCGGTPAWVDRFLNLRNLRNLRMAVFRIGCGSCPFSISTSWAGSRAT